MSPDDGSGELLKDACDLVISDDDLRPRDGRTFCNIGSLTVAQAMGCTEFDTEGDPLMADEMIALMEANASGKWSVASSSSEAALHALDGKLGFAAKTSAELGEAHGHLCVIYPASQQWSGSWGKEVPMCANVGRQNGEEKVSSAFPVNCGEPTYYLWSI